MVVPNRQPEGGIPQTPVLSGGSVLGHAVSTLSPASSLISQMALEYQLNPKLLRLVMEQRIPVLEENR